MEGILRSWNAERGFGFIAPRHGGAELFVHVSAFPRDGSQPVEGETLSYELGRGRDGRPQAVQVVRKAIGAHAPARRRLPASSKRHGMPLARVLGSFLLVAAVALGYSVYSKPRASRTHALAEGAATSPPTQSFRCDGRTYCSQMTSCAEATYFLKHCPGVKMDGNNDGVPCEQQWCK